MATIDRTNILKSPGTVEFDGATMFSEDDIQVTLIKELFDVQTSAFGRADRRVEGKRVEITITPKMWDNLDKLFPWATLQIGDVLYGATDKPAVITPRTGAPITVANCAVTSLAGIRLSATQSILTSMTITGLIANNAAPSALASYLSAGGSGSATLSGLDLAKIPNRHYSAAWGATSGIIGEQGFEVTFNMSTEPDVVDGIGTVNMRLTELEAQATVTPVGMTEAQLLTMIGFDTGIGGSPAKNNLVITGEGSGAPIVTINNALVQQAPYQYGPNANRVGQVQFESVRNISSGALAALWEFGAAGP